MKNNFNLTPFPYFKIITILLIIMVYCYQLELATFLYILINILINNLESISNYLKDYLEIDNILTTENDSIKEVTVDSKILDNNSIIININHPGQHLSINLKHS
jgi:hypothetical protein